MKQKSEKKKWEVGENLFEVTVSVLAFGGITTQYETIGTSVLTFISHSLAIGLICIKYVLAGFVIH